MKTFYFAEKNGNSAIILSAESEEKAIEYLEEIAKFPKGFRLDGGGIDEEKKD